MGGEKDMGKQVHSFAEFAAERLKRSARDTELDLAKHYLESWFRDIINFVRSKGVAEQYLNVSVKGPDYKIQVLDDSLTFTFSRKNIEVNYVSNDLENDNEFDTIVYHRGKLVSEKFEMEFDEPLFEKYLDWLRRTLRTFVKDL